AGHRAYRRDVGAWDGIGAPPFAGLGDNRLGKGAHDGRSAAGSGLKRARAGVAEGACRSDVADHVLHQPFPLVRRQTPVIDPIVATHRAFGCLRFKIRSSIADVQGHRSFFLNGPSLRPEGAPPTLITPMSN